MTMTSGLITVGLIMLLSISLVWKCVADLKLHPLLCKAILIAGFCAYAAGWLSALILGIWSMRLSP